MEKYQSILSVPYNKSTKRPNMSLNDRAAQFAPFAALNGHDESIQETSRLTESKINLNQEQKEIISLKLNYINDIKLQELVEITYFVPDYRKSGGKYKTIISSIKRVDTVNKLIIFTDNSSIEINKILDIHSNSIDLTFKNIEF